MSVSVHMTRADTVAESEAHPITLEEWLAFVENIPDFRHDGFAETTAPNGQTLRYESEGLCVWTGYPGEHTAWFDWRKGRIVVKNPDAPIITRMKQLAIHFKARLLTDDDLEP